jgi:hypothetical protein
VLCVLSPIWTLSHHPMADVAAVDPVLAVVDPLLSPLVAAAGLPVDQLKCGTHPFVDRWIDR